jgi:hypothetical protein
VCVVCVLVLVMLEGGSPLMMMLKEGKEGRAKDCCLLTLKEERAWRCRCCYWCRLCVGVWVWVLCVCVCGCVGVCRDEGRGEEGRRNSLILAGEAYVCVCVSLLAASLTHTSERMEAGQRLEDKQDSVF